MLTPELSYRLAIADDAPLITALVQLAYRGDVSRTGWTTEADLLDGPRIDVPQVEAIIADPDSDMLIAMDEQEEIIGCCQLVRRTPTLVYFGLFAISPAMQAGGIGRAILAEAEFLARKHWAASTMEMTVIGQRDELIAWYVRRGYTRTDEVRPFPYGDVRISRPLRDDLYFCVLTKQLEAPPA